MVALLQPPPVQRRHPNLILHCGAHTVQRGDIELVSTPRSTPSWHPISHISLISQVERALRASRLTIGTFAHSLTHDGARYFGLMEILGGDSHDDYCWVLGIRNSHDKTFPAGVVAGAQILVCDNLSFSGEVKLARKHTRYIARDLPGLVASGIGRMLEKWHDQARRFDAYKTSEINDTVAHDLVIRATDVGVCSNRAIPDVLKEWREPRHEEFESRTVWSLQNSFTEVLKENALAELPKRTEALHALLDSHVGLAFGRN